MVTNYCGLDGDVDLENARRTGQAYIQSGNWNPSINPTKAPPGTIFMGNGVDPDTGEVTRGKLWQKQDNGCSTNWSLITPGVLGSSVVNVDPVNGDDTTGQPYKTLSAALTAAAAMAGPATNDCTPKFPRPVVVMQPGQYVGNFVLPFNVSLFGYGFDNTQIVGNLSYVGALDEAGRSNITNVGITGDLDVDLSLGCNTNIRFINSRCSLIWDGGDTSAHFNNFLSHSSVFLNVTVVDGNVGLYNVQGIFGSLDVQDGAAGSTPNVAMVGGLLQGAVTAAGKAVLYLRGVLNFASMAGTIASATTPTLATDTGSLPDGAALSGDWNVQGEDQTVSISVADSPYTVTKESIILVDASGGDVDVVLPDAAARKGLPVTIKKLDSPGNDVNVSAAVGTVEGAATEVLNVQDQARTFSSDGVGNYAIIAGYN